MVDELTEGFSGPIHVVFGNNDGDRHDLVCWGHTHEWWLERYGDTVGLNPGEIMGRLGPTGFAVYETSTAEVERHEL